MSRRSLTEAEAEYLEAGVEPAHIIAVEDPKIKELLVHYLGDDVTLVETHGPRVTSHYAFDEIMDETEVLEEFEQSRWHDE